MILKNVYKFIQNLKGKKLMVKITDDNVVEECYTIICRLEAALEDVGDLRIYQIEENFNNWHNVVYDFMLELKKYRDNKIKNQ